MKNETQSAIKYLVRPFWIENPPPLKKVITAGDRFGDVITLDQHRLDRWRYAVAAGGRGGHNWNLKGNSTPDTQIEGICTLGHARRHQIARNEDWGARGITRREVAVCFYARGDIVVVGTTDGESSEYDREESDVDFVWEWMTQTLHNNRNE